MQFMMSVIADGTEVTNEAEQAAIDVFNDQLKIDGQWLFAGGLSTEAQVVDSRGGTPLFVDGPFAETKEFLAGFWIIDVESPAVAHELAATASVACNRKVEVRAFL